MNSYFDTNNKRMCNGCGACASRCPKNAITMKEDSEGFLYPVIDQNKCINCGLCKKICSNFPEENKFNIKVYAAKNINEEQRSQSTSGGMFKILAENIISKNGVVFGAKYTEELDVVHDYATTIDDCKKFSISKYVRSDLQDCYEKVEQFLKDDKWVLFTGTPCQVYGLKKYLRKDYDKLVLCDIMCHSNPSPKIFKLYKTNIEKKYNSKIKKYYFRSKNTEIRKRPHAILENNTIVDTSLFNTAFNQMMISRPSCSSCNFCSSNRKSDITIGDYWGIQYYFPDFDDSKGVSLLCINSEKGLRIFDEIKSRLDYKESNLNDAFKYNHHCNVPVHKNRDKFFKGISDGSINENNIIDKMNKYVKKPLYRRVLGKVKRTIKTILKKQK